MRTKGFSCERAEDGENAILEKNDTQNTFQNAEPMKLRYRNNSKKVGAKVKKTSFEMTLRSQSVGSENRIHKSKHKSNQLVENIDDRYNINKTKTKEAFGGEKSFELKSVVANLGADSTKEKDICATESNGRKKCKQAAISGDNEIDRASCRRSERLKRKSVSNVAGEIVAGEIPAMKKKKRSSSTNRREEKPNSSQKSDDAKEEREDTDLTDLRKPELSYDTVQSVILKVLPTFVDHMDPKKITDRMLESNNYRPSILRDIMDNVNTSDRNRKLLDWISRSDVSVYTHFKQCLLETKQINLFTLLETTEKDGDTREITTNIRQNTIQLNSEGNKLYSELVAKADLRDKQIICLEFENIGAPVCRALLEKKINDSKPKDDTGLTWTIDTFLNSKRDIIEKIDSHVLKLGINNIFPKAKLDSWGFSLFCHILINTCEMTPSLRHCLEWLLEQRENVSQYNDENQKRKLSKLRKHLMIIAAETEDDDLIKTVEERLSRLERGVFPDTDCEVIDTSLQRTKEELIEEIKCNRASIDSCIQGQSEVKNDIIKGSEQIGKKLDTLIAKVEQLENNNSQKRREQSVPATTTVKILVKGSESEHNICSQLVRAFRCRGTSQLSNAVNEVCTQFQSKDWTVIDAKVGCIELYIQCSSVLSLLTLLRDYVNGNLDIYLEPLEKAARLLDGCADIKFETFFHAETVYNILSSIDFQQFEMKSNDVYAENPDHGPNNSTNTADVAFVEVINVQGSDLDNLKVASDEGNDLPEENSNSKTRLVLLGFNFGNDSEKVKNNIPDTNGHKESLELTEYRLGHSPTSAMSDSGSQNAKPTMLKSCDESRYPVKNLVETTSSPDLKENGEAMHMERPADFIKDDLNSTETKIYRELKEHEQDMHTDRQADYYNPIIFVKRMYRDPMIGIEPLIIHKAHNVSRTGAAFAMNISVGDHILLVGEDRFAPEHSAIALEHSAIVKRISSDIKIDGQPRFSLDLIQFKRATGTSCRVMETRAILTYVDLYNEKSRDAFEKLRQQIVREHQRYAPSYFREDENVPGTKTGSDDNRRGNYDHVAFYLYAGLKYLISFEIKRRGLFPNKIKRTQINNQISLTEKYKSKLDNNLVSVINLLKHYDPTQLQFICDNKLTFSSEPFKSLFKCLVDTITILGQVIILDVANILACRYTDSQRLLSVVKANLPRIKDEILQEEVTSFLKGELTYTHMPRQIPNRVMKFTYGIKTNLQFREGIDPEGKRMHCDRGDTCKQRFTKHVEIGQSVNVGEPQTEFSYSPLNKSQTRMCLYVYASELENPQYTDDKCTFVGKLIVDLSNHGDLNRYVKVSLTFKDNKIVVTARDMKTGTKSAVAFASLG